MTKKLFSLFALIGCIAIGGAITSCGGKAPEGETPDSGDNNPGGNEGEGENGGEGESGGGDAEANDYKFEAEYTDLTGVQGGGISGSAAGTMMIVDAPKASNELAVGYLHREGVAVTFKIVSPAAGTAKLTLGLGNELSNSMEFNPTTYIMKVNGTALNYRKFVVKADNVAVPGTEFYEYKVNSTINLVEGENTLVFETGVNDYINNGSGGPVFDYIILNTTQALTWTPMEDNI